jgi:hypothetical protein
MDSDILIEQSGPICLLLAETDAGRDWLVRPRGDRKGWQPAGRTIAVDNPRIAQEIAASATADGLSVEWMRA